VGEAPSVFSKNRDWLIKHDAVIEFFNEVLAIAQNRDWLHGETSVSTATLIQAWAEHKSFMRWDDSGRLQESQTQQRVASSSSTQPTVRFSAATSILLRPTAKFETGSCEEPLRCFIPRRNLCTA